MKPSNFTIATMVGLSASLAMMGQTMDKSNYDDVIFSNHHTYSPSKTNNISITPSNQKTLFENAEVKVTQISIPPNASEHVYLQPWQGILYIQEGNNFKIATPEGNVIFDSKKLQNPLVYYENIYKQPGIVRSTVNTNKMQPINLIRVEMKQ